VSVSVVIPYRPDGGSRDRALAWVLGRWAAECPDWQVIVESDDGGPWRKGVAVAHGLALARGDVVVIADADSWSPGVREAAERIAAGVPWMMPHTEVVRLTADATEAVLAGAALDETAAKKANRELAYTQATAGGIVVLRREVARDVPIDPRFADWGGEDISWRYALENLVAPRRRLPGALYHLWHEPATERVRGVTPESDRLRMRYAKARHDRTRMRALVDEAKAWLAEARAA